MDLTYLLEQVWTGSMDEFKVLPYDIQTLIFEQTLAIYSAQLVLHEHHVWQWTCLNKVDELWLRRARAQANKHIPTPQLHNEHVNLLERVTRQRQREQEEFESLSPWAKVAIANKKIWDAHCGPLLYVAYGKTLPKTKIVNDDGGFDDGEDWRPIFLRRQDLPELEAIDPSFLASESVGRSLIFGDSISFPAESPHLSDEIAEDQNTFWFAALDEPKEDRKVTQAMLNTFHNAWNQR